MGESEQSAPIAVKHASAAVDFEYEHAQLSYRTRIRLGGNREWRATGRRIATRVRLDPAAASEIELRIDPADADGATHQDASAEREAHVRQWRARFARVSSPRNGTFEQVVASNVRDFASFALLEGARDEWLALHAGMPLYPALFGRDAITAGRQAASIDGGDALDAALTRLGRMQSDRVDDWRDAEPGRIPYQVRRGPLAILNLNPYAGSSTRCCGETCTRSG